MSIFYIFFMCSHRSIWLTRSSAKMNIIFGLCCADPVTEKTSSSNSESVAAIGVVGDNVCDLGETKWDFLLVPYYCYTEMFNIQSVILQCCGDANRGTQWRCDPVNNEGQAASRRDQSRVETFVWMLSWSWLLEVWTVSVAALRNATTGIPSWSANQYTVCRTAVWPRPVVYTLDRVSFVLLSGFGRCAGRVRRLCRGRAKWCETGPFVNLNVYVIEITTPRARRG